MIGSSPPVVREPGRHLALVGPTASGKSAVAVELALLRIRSGRPTEIVSCDSMAVYRGMDVGTATPTIEERGGVRHHLLDVVDPSEEFSVQRFVTLVDDALDGIEARGASAILVGGTGLYVQAVVDGFELPGRYPHVVAELDPLDDAELRDRLVELDPLGAQRVPPGNRRRLIRALEVTIGSGRPFSESGPGMTAFGSTPFVLAGLAVDRAELTGRITERFARQMEAGFLDEVTGLAARRPSLSRTAAEALGYRELLAHLRGECDLEAARATAVRRTRRFAVRQQRWFGRDPRITWFEVGGPDPVGASILAASIDDHWHPSPGGSTGAELDAGAEGPATTVGPSCCD